MIDSSRDLGKVEGTFYQFPVACLRDNFKEQGIVKYHLANYARYLRSKDEEDQAAWPYINIAERLADESQLNQQVFDCHDDGPYLLIAAEQFRTALPAVKTAVSCFAYRDEVDARPHGGVIARIGRDFWWAMGRAKWNPLRIATLAAISAAVGNRPYQQTTLDHIRALARGYNAERYLPDECVYARDPKKERFAVQHQVEWLWKHKLISKASRDRKHWFYSWRLGQSELEGIIQRKPLKVFRGDSDSQSTEGIHRLA